MLLNLQLKELYLSVHKGKDNRVIVSIKDTGSGIDHEVLPRLFTKFSAKSFEGTGLGLFISKNIVEAHGGKIWAENNMMLMGKRELPFTFCFR